MILTSYHLRKPRPCQLLALIASCHNSCFICVCSNFIGLKKLWVGHFTMRLLKMSWQRPSQLRRKPKPRHLPSPKPNRLVLPIALHRSWLRNIPEVQGRDLPTRLQQRGSKGSNQRLTKPRSLKNFARYLWGLVCMCNVYLTCVVSMH